MTVHVEAQLVGCKYQGIHQNHSAFICIVIYHPNSVLWEGMQLVIPNLYMVQLLDLAGTYLVRNRQTADQLMLLKYTNIIYTDYMSFDYIFR